MTEDMAARLRVLAELVLVTPEEDLGQVAGSLESMAAEWERLNPVRDAASQVLQAARAWSQDPYTCQGARTWDDLLAAQKSLDAAVEHALPVAEEPAPAEWKPGTWAEVTAGDRVRIGTTEADVDSVLPIQWLGSRARQIQVRLKGRDPLYSMPPSGLVEICKGAAGQAVEEAGVTVLASWAAEAVRTLAAMHWDPEAI